MSTSQRSSEKFTMPKDIVARASVETRRGVKIHLNPHEMVMTMRQIDLALNGDSNDVEHDALSIVREWLSEVFEDPKRRTHG